MVDNYFAAAHASSTSLPFDDFSGEDISTSAGAAPQDRLLPIANVGRMMKQILPPNAKISKEAKETMQECVSEFISFVTGEASDKCHREKRKTVNGDDVCWALSSLGFDDYCSPLKTYLLRYRELEGERAARSDHYNTAPSGSGIKRTTAHEEEDEEEELLVRHHHHSRPSKFPAI